MDMSLYERIKLELTPCQDVAEVMPPCDPDVGGGSAATSPRINLTTGDYLGLASDRALMEAFFDVLQAEERRADKTALNAMDNAEERRLLENWLQARYGSASVLVFGSAYHANMGILPTLAGPDTCVLMDEAVHDTLADGIRISGLRHAYFPHNDLTALVEQLDRIEATDSGTRVIVVVESLFSVSGDPADLFGLTALKKRYPNLLLYVDEAQAMGVRGPTGLGLAEETGLLGEIDFLVGVFGKALASTGAFLSAGARVSPSLNRTMRTVLMNTALPPINLRWTRFVLDQLPSYADHRERLSRESRRVADAVRATGRVCVSDSQIISIPFSTRGDARRFSGQLLGAGFCVPAVQTGDADDRCAIRLSLSAAMHPDALNRLVRIITDLPQETHA